MLVTVMIAALVVQSMALALSIKLGNGELSLSGNETLPVILMLVTAH